MSRYEEPAYTVVATSREFEVRRYDSYLAAETTVTGDFDSTGNIAFRRLAGFIFGGNSAALKMNMTVPVTRERSGVDDYRYRFVIEKAYAHEQLPRPLDQSVRVVRVAAGHYAAVRYRGRRTFARYRRTEAALLASLQRANVETTGTAVSAVYNGPFTPPVMRRNEVLVPIAWGEREEETTR